MVFLFIYYFILYFFTFVNFFVVFNFFNLHEQNFEGNLGKLISWDFI